MTEPAISTGQSDELLADVPFEAVPHLVANERAHYVMERLRELKTRMDQDEKEFELLKTEAGALVATAGVASIAYIDLRVGNTRASEPTKKVTASALCNYYGGVDNMSWEGLRAVALAAKELDEDKLAQNGIAAAHIAQARVPVGSGRKGSTRVEWIGAKGKGGKQRAAGGGAVVQ